MGWGVESGNCGCEGPLVGRGSTVEALKRDRRGCNEMADTAGGDSRSLECRDEDFLYSERQKEATEELERVHLDMIKLVFMADISGCSVEHE